MPSDWWWDASWNVVAGCEHVSAGCKFCYAQQQAGTLHRSSGIERAVTPLYATVTDLARGRRVFNGKLAVLPPGHTAWTWPLRWRGALSPVMGVGRPSLIWACDMSDLFIETRPISEIDRVVSILTASHHVGLLLTKRPHRMADYFAGQAALTQQRWRAKLWLGFSAERQKEFDERWPHVRQLAADGWTVFVSIAPMLGPVVLPAHLLYFGDRAWVICSGEQGLHARPMDPRWCRSVRDQCAEAGVPFFMKQMSGKSRIPADLLIRQFPVRPC